MPDGTPDAGVEKPTLDAISDPTVTVGLLMAALAMQRRVNLALYQSVRGRSGPIARPARRAGSERRSRTPVARRRSTNKSTGSPGRTAATTEDLIAPSPRDLALLQVRCFGRFEVLRDGVPIEHWRRGKAKTLLKHLVARRQPVPRDVLIELLWPDADPRTAVNGLRVALHALRQALGSGPASGRGERDVVIFESGNYCVNPASGLWVDADEFASHFMAGRRLERQGGLAAAIAHFEKAEAVYRDDYLIEDIYEDWTLVRREELKDQYLMVLTKLADICLDEGDAEGCIVRCHKILQKDTCREDAYRRLMCCYAQLNQPSQALHWFGLCARTLRQELDVAPSELTLKLYREISAGQRGDLPVIAPARWRISHRAGGHQLADEGRGW